MVDYSDAESDLESLAFEGGPLFMQGSLVSSSDGQAKGLHAAGHEDTLCVLTNSSFAVSFSRRHMEASQPCRNDVERAKNVICDLHRCLCSV